MVRILSKIENWFSSRFLMLTTIIPVKNRITSQMNPATLIIFISGSGHFEHLNPESGWYLSFSKIAQSDHK